MANKYEVYTEGEITRKVLDSLVFNDLVKINKWKRPLRVRAISKNFIVMTLPAFGTYVYSIIEKTKADFRRNNIEEGYFTCGRDDAVFGPYIDLGNATLAELDGYLREFERGDYGISVRVGTAIHSIAIKKG